MPVTHPNKVSLAETLSDPGLPDRGWVAMDVRWLVTKETVGATKTVFGVTIFPPGAKHELHRHPNVEEVEYLVSGCGLAYIHDEVVPLAPGDAIFVPQNAYHGFENNGEEDAVLAWYYAGAASLADAGFAMFDEDQTIR